MLPVKKILCPTDFSEPSLVALETARELAEHFDAELRVLHVLALAPPFPGGVVMVAAPDAYPSDAERFEVARERLDELIREHLPEHPRVVPEVRMGDAPHEIVFVAEQTDADLIVIGTHGETGWRHLAFGSVAETIVRMAHRPVLTVHGEPA